MAIAFDTAADLGNNGGTTNSQSGSYTCTGTNRILYIGIVGDVHGGADDITGVTYNGVSATLVQKNTNANINRYAYLYVLVNPASGSNTLAVTCTNNHYLFVGAASYTGAAQTGQPDASSNTLSGPSVNTQTTSVTPVASNCWAHLFSTGYDAVATNPTAGTGSTRRSNEATFGAWGLFDSNGTVTAGSGYNMTALRTTTLNYMCGLMATTAPYTAADITVAATGSSITATAGTVSESGAANVTSTGNSIAATVHSVTTTAGATVASSGNSIAASVGTVSVTGTAVVTTTGNSLAATVHSVSITGDANVVSTGNSITATAGTVTTSAGVSVAVTGNLLSLSVGTPTLTGNANVTATGNEIDITVNSVGVHAGGSTMVQATDNTITLTAGSVTVSTGTSVAVTGNVLTLTVGSVTVTTTGPPTINVNFVDTGTHNFISQEIGTGVHS